METTTENSQNMKSNDQDFNLVQQAHEFFNRQDYAKCLDLLNQLLNTRGNNNTIIHNRAVANFYKSDCKNYKELLTILESLEEEKIGNVNEIPIALYNKAVIYFHRHMHMVAFDMLEPLCKNLDKLDDKMAGLIGILFLRLMIAKNLLTRSAAFVDVLQKHLGINMESSILTDESPSPEASSSSDGFTRTFKLLALLVHALNRKSVVITDDGTAEMAALKARQYYIMKDFQMAAKQLQKIKQIAGTLNGINVNELDTCIANNMGVIQLRVRHYAIATQFFQKALNFEKNISLGIKEAALQNMSAIRSVEILYNLGIALLHLRRPTEAFQCFLVPIKSYHNNPRLWLRIAEACIMDHEMKTIEADKKPMMRGTIQIGSRKHYVIKPTPKIMYTSNQSPAMPEPTLEFAVLCLRNALVLTNLFHNIYCKREAEEEKYVEGEHTEWYKQKDHSYCNPSMPVSKDNLDTLLLAVYAAHSYVSLRIGDYTTALEMAENLLKSDNLSDAHKLLAHMYAGEALIMMDKLPDARPHLDPTFATSLNAFDLETKDWQVKSLDAAQNIVRYNLAVAMMLQGDVVMARNLLKSCKHAMVVHKSKSLRVYLHLISRDYDY